MSKHISDSKALLTPALRQYQRNNGSGLLFGYEKQETESIVSELRTQLAKANERVKELEKELIQADSTNLELSFALNKVKDFVTFDFEGKDECLSRLSRIISSEQQQAHVNLNKFAIEKKIEALLTLSDEYTTEVHDAYKGRYVEVVYPKSIQDLILKLLKEQGSE